MEPTSAYTFYDLILRVSKAAGVSYYGEDGQERACIPYEEHDLERCKDCVNDGIKMFIADAPENGWRWMRREAKVTFGIVETTGECDSAGDATSLIDSDLADTYDTDDEIVGYYVYDLTQEIYGVCTAYNATLGDITVTEWLDYNGNASSLTPADEDSYSITDVQTVEGDKARYLLPEDFRGHPTGRITYDKDSNRGHIIDWAGEGEIRTWREVSVTSGHPTKAAVRPWGSRRWELVVDPSPSAADSVVFPYETGFDALRLVAGNINTSAATSITDDSLGAFFPTDYFKGWVIHVMAGTGRGSYATVTGYTSASGKFTVASSVAAGGSGTGTTPDSEAVYYAEPVNNKHPAGQQFDEAILSACLAKAEGEFGELNLGYSPMEKYLKKDLPAAHAIDARSAPRKLGKMRSGSGRKYYQERTWSDITTENDM